MTLGGAIVKPPSGAVVSQSNPALNLLPEHVLDVGVQELHDGLGQWNVTWVIGDLTKKALGAGRGR
jgi:hypothetical protein